MSAERIEIAALIESLADGRAIDWPALDGRASTQAERRRYRNLRLLARLTELHRTLPLEADEVPQDASLSTPAVDGPMERWGDLAILERVAAGSFGDVYRAHDPQLDREVALKILRPGPSAGGVVHRLLEEARTLARVRHENVVTVHGADVRDGRAGLWMEFVHGQTLHTWLAAHGRMGAMEACVLGQAVCRALAAVHGAGLIHGDVKAQNIVREDGGRIVLMDFGAGHAQGARSAGNAGTPLYLAPEVLAGSPATSQSDIYSAGVLLFHALTTGYPYAAGTLEELRLRHASGERVMLRDLRPELPDDVVHAVERALHPDPVARFSSAGEMEAALAAALHATTPRRNRAIYGALALVAVTLLGLSAAMWRGDRTEGTAAAALAGTVAIWPFVSDAAPGTETELLEGLTGDVLRALQQFEIETRRLATGRPTGVRADDERAVRADAALRGEIVRAAGTRTLRTTIVRAGGATPLTREYPLPDPVPPTLARTVAADVAKTLGARGSSQQAPGRGTSNPSAYDAYLRGRTLWEQRTPASLERSLRYFAESATLDPAFAEPWAGMADAYITLGVAAFGPLRPMEARRLAKEAALKALERNPTIAEAHTSLAFAAFFHDWDWSVAAERFKKALELNPQYALAHHWYADYLNAMGRHEEAMSEILRAQQLEPLSLIVHRDVAWHLFFQKRYAEAAAQLERTLDRDPDYTAARTLLARTLAELGRTGEALVHLRRAEPPSRAGTHLTYVAYVQAKGGEVGAARETLASIGRLRSREYVPPYNIALVYAALDQADDAIRELSRAVDEQDSTVVNLRVDPRLATLHGDARFQQLLRRLRFPQ